MKQQLKLWIHYIFKMINPFIKENSPILSLFQKSKEQSHINHKLERSTAKSYLQYKTTLIQNALKNNHIIHRQPQQKTKYTKQERQFSKYYGIQTLKTTPFSQLQKKIINFPPNKIEHIQKIDKITYPNTGMLQVNQRDCQGELRPFQNKNKKKYSNFQILSANSFQQQHFEHSSCKKISQKQIGDFYNKLIENNKQNIDLVNEDY